MKTVGVLGGMGPRATIRFLDVFVSQFAQESDRSVPRVLVDINTQLPSRTRFALGIGPSPLPGLRDALDELRMAGAQVLAVPCNSADSLLGSEGVAHHPDYVSIVAESCKAALVSLRRGESHSKVLVLGGRALEITGRYRQELELGGATAVFPVEELQKEVDRLIELVKQQGFERTSSVVSEELKSVINCYKADVTILACTELDLPDLQVLPTDIVSSTRALALAVARRCGLNGSVLRG